VPLNCTVTVAGVPVAPGQCALADRLEAVAFPASGLCLIAQPV
jgi:regulator of RNase E activity RraA